MMASRGVVPEGIVVLYGVKIDRLDFLASCVVARFTSVSLRIRYLL